MKRALALAAVLTMVPFVIPASVHGAPPSNDNFANATQVSAVPFSAAIDLAEATGEAGEPMGCASHIGDVWFRMPTTSSQQVYSLTLSAPGVQLWGAVYLDTGSGITGLQMIIGCLYLGQPANVTVGAGQTYYVRVARGYYATTTLAQLDIASLSPPANDNFADATAISSLPFEEDVATAGASIESGEPILCTPPSSEKTVWYSFTARSNDSVTARFTAASAPAGIAAYTGSSLTGLTPLGCQYGFPLTIDVVAGTTYYFQAGGFGQYGPQLRFALDYAGPDTTPPDLSTPTAVSANAVSPSGAPVRYEDLVTATDNRDPSPTLTCAPPSGSVFGIGVTTVTCHATDTAGNIATASFPVTVRGAPEQLATLLHDVQGVGPGTSLADKVMGARAAYTAGEAARTCEILNAFINQVKAQTGKNITDPATANTLVADATRIRAVLGC